MTPECLVSHSDETSHVRNRKLTGLWPPNLILWTFLTIAVQGVGQNSAYWTLRGERQKDEKNAVAHRTLRAVVNVSAPLPWDRLSCGSFSSN